MGLKDRIQQDLMDAIRQHDAERASVLRLLKADIRNEEIAQQRELDEKELQGVLVKAAKQRRESIEAYGAGGRDDLVVAEERELQMIESYLPRQLTEEQLRPIVAQAIRELGAQGMGDIGLVMKHLMTELRGQADGRLINSLVREALTQ